MYHEIVETLYSINDTIDGFLNENNQPNLIGSGDRDLLDIYTETGSLINRLQAIQAVTLAKMEESNAVFKVTGDTSANWIARAEGVSTRAAVKRIRQAASFNSHRHVAEKAVSGALSMAKAQAICSALSWLPDGLSEKQLDLGEKLLIDLAPKTTVPQLNKSSELILNRIAPTEDPRVIRDRKSILAFRRRYLTIIDNCDGTTSLYGCLPSLAAAPFVKILKSFANRPHQESIGEPITADDITSPSKRLADALVEFAASHLRLSGTPTIAGDRPRIIVSVKLKDLENRALSAKLIDQDHLLTPGEIRRLCCDANIVPMVLGGKSEILDIGRNSRVVPLGIRTALIVRDQGCTFPGCDRTPSECEVHHITPWLKGGHTELSNLVLLCAYHHKLIEPDFPNNPETSWQVWIREDGVVHYRKPGRRSSMIHHERYNNLEKHLSSKKTDERKYKVIRLPEASQISMVLENTKRVTIDPEGSDN